MTGKKQESSCAVYDKTAKFDEKVHTLMFKPGLCQIKNITNCKGRSPEKILLFFWILSKLPSPQFGQLVQLFSDVEIQDLKVSAGLKILCILYII